MGLKLFAIEWKPQAKHTGGVLRQMGTSTTTAWGMLLLLPCSSGWKHLLVPSCHRDHGERDGRRKDRQTASSTREQPHVPGEHPSRAIRVCGGRWASADLALAW